MVVLYYSDLFLSQLIITVFARSVVLLRLQSTVSDLFVDSIDIPSHAINLLRSVSVCFQQV